MSDLRKIIPFLHCKAIPVRRVGQSGTQRIGLSDLACYSNQIADIALPPIQRLAVLRWLLLCDASPRNPFDLQEAWPLYGKAAFPEEFIAGALQCDEPLPVASARSSRDVLEMRDGNNMALDPTPGGPPEIGQDILALLTSYFCDRPGLKARVPGLPISGRCPLHMGRTTVFKAWGNLAEFVELNRVDGMADYLAHRWRRLQFVAPGQLVIAAGDDWDGFDRDPWVLRKSHPSHVGKPVAADMVADEKRAGVFVQGLEVGQAIDITGIALQQASPLAVWQERGKVVAA